MHVWEGHGKGTWDGIGGILKKMLAQAILYEDKIQTSSGLIQTSKDCHEHAHNVFSHPDWIRKHQNSPVSEFECFYADEAKGDIDRSLAPYAYDSVPGIMSMRQFLRHSDGILLCRTFTCWCPACWKVVRRGEGCDSVGVVPGCESSVGAWRAHYKYEDRQVQCHEPSKVARTRAQTKAAGKEMCLRTLKPGMFLAIQVEQQRDHFWIARALDVGDRSCFYRRDFEQTTRINKTSYCPGMIYCMLLV